MFFLGEKSSKGNTVFLKTEYSLIKSLISGKRICLKTKNKTFFFLGRGSPYLCLLATVLKFLEIMFLVESKSA
jgi:hypothetical protein